jgi:[histone H3]-lysine36 N-dimethyltransferase SETMAR
MLYEYNRGNNATNATNNITNVYGVSALNVRKCQRWFSRFKSGKYDLGDFKGRGRKICFDYNVLISLLEQDDGVTTEKLAQCLDSSSATVYRHLKKLGKVSKLGN